MTKSFTKLLTGLLVVFSWCSCYVPEGGYIPEDNNNMRLEFKNVALRFGFNNFLIKKKYPIILQEIIRNFVITMVLCLITIIRVKLRSCLPF